MSRLTRALALTTLVLAALGASAAAAAGTQVNTCVYADGGIVYTDKPCATLGATKAPEGTRPSLVSRYRNTCARDLPSLMIELSTAIEIGDVNQLAAYYQWTGLSTRAGYDVMDRLEAITARPLVDIVPLFATPAPAPGSPYFPPLDAHRPIGLRIEQTRKNGTTPASTTLRLARQAGCWWVRL